MVITTCGEECTSCSYRNLGWEYSLPIFKMIILRLNLPTKKIFGSMLKTSQVPMLLFVIMSLFVFIKPIQTTYIIYIDDIPVGYGRIRHSSTEYLETVVGAGNLGYGISKEHRGKGYGNVLFQELLKKCAEHGYDEIKLFPLKSNEATIKIMLKNGGAIIGSFKNEKPRCFKLNLILDR